MDIVLFQDLTTEDHIQALEAEALKYDGLYVDMENLQERKYVKEGAKKINDLIKVIGRARIDKTAQYKLDANIEAGAITERLANANKPFTLLIDEYTEQRAKILQAEKDRVLAVEDAVKLEGDHEYALLLNEKFDRDQADLLKGQAERLAQEEAARVERERKIAENAAENARLSEIARHNAEQQREEKEAAARIADHEHRRRINKKVLEAFKSAGITEEQAKEVIKKILTGSYPVTINY